MSCSNSISDLAKCSQYLVVKNGSWAMPSVSDSSLMVYLPGQCQGDHISEDPSHVNYFTLVSKDRKQPVFTMWVDRGKAVEDFVALHSKRPSFVSCCLDGTSKKDYSGTGFSKGHQVAMADMGLLSCGESNCANSTFTLCNMSPQNEVMNGHAWGKLEAGSRACVSDDRNVVVYTGPLFEDGGKYCMKKGLCTGNACNTYLGKDGWVEDASKYNLCASNPGIVVPTAFYKVVIIKSGGSVKTYPIVMRHAVPGYPDNGAVIASGQKAWDMMVHGLSGFSFPSIVSSNVQEFDQSGWAAGKCPAGGGQHALRAAKAGGQCDRTHLYVIIGVLALLLLVAVGYIVYRHRK